MLIRCEQPENLDTCTTRMFTLPMKECYIIPYTEMATQTNSNYHKHNKPNSCSYNVIA